MTLLFRYLLRQELWVREIRQKLRLSFMMYVPPPSLFLTTFGSDVRYADFIDCLNVIL